MWPVFFLALFLCAPSTACLLVCIRDVSLSLYSLSLSVTLSENISPTSPPHAPTLFYSISLFHWPRAPRGDGTLGSFDIGMLVKALQHVRMACELTLPYWHTFYANELPGLGDKATRRRGPERERALTRLSTSRTYPVFTGAVRGFSIVRETICHS